jgi:hypothetical protein
MKKYAPPINYNKIPEISHSIGISILNFIDKNILNALNFWKDNKTADFSKIVDNIKIFDFIDDIRTKKIMGFSI